MLIALSEREKMSPASPDSVTVDIVGAHLLAIAEEMGVALIRAAYSPNVKERHDCSTSLLDRDGQTIAQAEHIPLHMGSMLGFIPQLVEVFEDDINPGDVFIANDPYVGGSTHLPDVVVVAPLFDAEGLAGFAATVAHHAEFGGSLGSSPDIFGEGLRIPPVRIFHKGVLDDDVLRLILLNCRNPRERLGDLRAQFAAVRLGATRYDELCGKYESAVVRTATGAWLDKAETQARAALAQLPAGVYSFEDWMDYDGAGTTDIPIRVTLRVDDSGIVIDFDGTADQVKGQINAVRSGINATVYFTVKAILDPDLPANAGFYRAITIETRPGSIVDPLSPAPVWSRSDTCQRVADAILGAFAQAVPDRVPAASHGSVTAIHLSGHDPRRDEFFSYVEVLGGGFGARPASDGPDAVQSHVTNTANTPAEALEIAYPLRVEAYALRERSGGAGKYRGGMGICRDVRVLVDGVHLTVKGDRVQRGPWGLRGGAPGAPLDFLLDPGTDHERRLRRPDNGSVIPKDSIVRVLSAGGGGYGPPHERDPHAAREDRLDGLEPAPANASEGSSQ
ncbi:hydantoinase B/oxoprolinase family protein [Amycolatopsis thermoflava]|uniref:N-methylhydantoinase B n=1 Tax=Amycolatopsis thermoflava TaxID=84480 RepID=A0A3N2GPD0_9PSEU|nr:hydantoinase B/oxoprolinase family protein [Amycolatopsis thermoflava]ROS38486.1 N-methylhydantoinase B [Amycolatopsis thermoflava]